MKEILGYKKQYQKILSKWTQNHLVGLFVFNILVILLLLLRSGGYFSPYYSITINAVVFMSLLATAFLIGARSKTFFIIGLILWLFAAFLRLSGIEVWAERTAVYVYQTLILGTALFLVENINSNVFKK